MKRFETDSFLSVMELVLEEAARAVAHGDVPVAAACVLEGEVIALRHNEKELTGNPAAHAEMLALRDATLALGETYLYRTCLVVSLEPCAMCAGAMILHRIGGLVFAAYDPKAGACGSLYNLCADPRLNHEIEVASGVMEVESSALLKSFFLELRS